MAASCCFCLRVRPSSGMSSSGPQKMYMRELPPNFSMSPTLRTAHTLRSHFHKHCSLSPSYAMKCCKTPTSSTQALSGEDSCSGRPCITGVPAYTRTFA